MSDSGTAPNLPAQIADAIVSVPKGLVPAAVKALDRLIGATVDIPVAWLAQHKAKIDAQTEAYKLVEGAIASAAASEAGADIETVNRAVQVLVRKEYRKQANREAVASAMIENLSSASGDEPVPEDKIDPAAASDVEDDWLNVFERYAEDASSERMQKLWGRVLAGEVRRPGRYSHRTLRFLAEFSQADALLFETLCTKTFGDAAPKSLVHPDETRDIRDLIYLEASGLIQGGTGLGLSRTFDINEDGYTFMREDDLIVVFKGPPKTKVENECIVLTPLGQELVSLLPGRDRRAAARAVAHAMRVPAFEEAYLGVAGKPGAPLTQVEVLWLKEVTRPT